MIAVSDEATGMFASLTDPQAFLRHDIAFHQAVAAASGNPILSALVNMVAEQFREQRQRTIDHARDLEGSRRRAPRDLPVAARARRRPRAARDARSPGAGQPRADDEAAGAGVPAGDGEIPGTVAGTGRPVRPVPEPHGRHHRKGIPCRESNAPSASTAGSSARSSSWRRRSTTSTGRSWRSSRSSSTRSSGGPTSSSAW